MAWKWKRPAASLSENSITEGVIWKNLLFFFFPIMLGSCFQQLYNTVDSIIVGKFVGKEALAAVGGPAASIINLIVGFFIGFSSGATVILSQCYGGRKDREVGQAVHTAFALAITCGAVIMALGFGLSRTMLELIGTPPEIMDASMSYLNIYFAGMIPSLIYNIGSGLLRAVGDSRRPLYYLIAACMTNVVLDVLFVVGLEMGVTGVALATVISQLLSAVLVVIALARSNTTYRLYPARIRFHGNLFARIVHIGLPAGLQQTMYALPNAVVQSGINSFGTDVVAAYTAFGKLDVIYWMILGAFGVAITTFVGQNFGAGKYDRVRRSVKVCFGMAIAVTAVVCLLLLTFGERLYGLFTDDAAVVAYGMRMLRLIVPGYFLFVAIEVLSGTLRGVGDTLRPTLFTLVGICLLRMAWVLFIAPMNRTLEMMMLCYPVTWLAASLLFSVYYLKGDWMGRAIRRAGVKQA